MTRQRGMCPCLLEFTLRLRKTPEFCQYQTRCETRKCHGLRQKKGHLPQVSKQSRLSDEKDDNKLGTEVVLRTPGIHFKAQENPGTWSI